MISYFLSFAPELSAFFSHFCAERGIELRAKDAAAGFQGGSRVEAVATRSGVVFPCDLVVVAIGVTPDIEFLRDSGIRILREQRCEIEAADVLEENDYAGHEHDVANAGDYERPLGRARG